MKTLIAEDDLTSRILMQKLLSPYGEAHAAMNGREAADAWRAAADAGEPYDLVCLDIMMPGTNGLAGLRWIRAFEADRPALKAHPVKIIMTSAVNDRKNVNEAIAGGCDGYLLKPIIKDQLLARLKEFGLIPAAG